MAIVVTIGSEFDAHFPSRLQYGVTANSRFDNIKNTLLHLRGQIRDAPEANEIVGTAGPRIAAADLHPTVWNAAAPVETANNAVPDPVCGLA